MFPLYSYLRKPDIVLIMGNYSPMKCAGKNIVLLRHPYLVDSSIRNEIGVLEKIIEEIRGILFFLTIQFADIVVVQSGYMKDLFFRKYKTRNVRIMVLPNPLSQGVVSSDMAIEIRQGLDENIILYVSRYYPHKNHEFIIDLARKHSDILKAKDIKFFITVDPDSGKYAEKLLRIIKEENLDDIVINIGEIPWSEMRRYYEKSVCLFFPSKSESFGNPLIEAMAHGKPIVVPDLGYAHAICEDAGLYFKPNDMDDALRYLTEICENQELWEEYSKKSIDRAKKFPSVEKWARMILKIGV
ncbi:MAG: glycosyltransferase [Candidatus Aenigmarchaeota archaeon]|nr:glycosyltransferase [Candidatus Aenigmarchaeota archaeon]